MRYLSFRAGIEKNTGTHWLRVEQPKEGKVVFKQLEVEGDMLVATDKDNNVFYKIGYSKDLKGKPMKLKFQKYQIFFLKSANNETVMPGFRLNRHSLKEAKITIKNIFLLDSHDSPTCINLRK